MPTETQRELAGVVDDLAQLIDGDYWAEELIPPMTDDPDEVVEGASVTRGDGYDHKGEMAGFTLWRGQVGYRVIVSKLPD